MNERGLHSYQRIIKKANRLFYMQGYNQTSIADVANAVGITKGNLNYHFRSKDDLLEAVIKFRKDSIEQMLSEWELEYSDHKDRLRRFVQMMLNEEQNLIRYGCAVGSLNVELAKYQQPMQLKSREMFDLFRGYLEKSFRVIDKDKSESLSLHFLTMAQGAVLMSYVYADSDLLKQECNNILDWIDTL